MKLKVPPGIIAAVCAILMWVIYKYLSWSNLHFSFPLWIPVSIAAVGGLFGLVGLIQFYTYQTSIDPHKPDKATALVSSGIYRFSRNPMYLGLLVTLIAWGIHLGSSFSFLILPLFVWYMNRFQIKPEEEILEQQFGTGYRSYKKNVRRWI